MNCYAAYAKDEKIRLMGSSGGLFPLFSIKHIEAGGVVYASIYDEDFTVYFERITSVHDLKKSFGSKYVQSRTGDCFKNVKNDLQSNLHVLFCGTPCQVFGLKNYLKTSNINIDKLITIDFICHGVPSELAFKSYLNQFPSQCTYLNMRNKDNGWNYGQYSWKMKFSDGSENIVSQTKIPYMRGFLSNIYLRPSCYKCTFKGESSADITLGDFWGISEINKDISAEKGVSCVIIRSKIGNNYFIQNMESIECTVVNYHDILIGNPSLESSVRKPFFRKLFFKKLKKGYKFNDLVNKLCVPTLTNRIINKIYSQTPHRKTKTKDVVCQNNLLTTYQFKENCCGCMACISICPTNSIHETIDHEGFRYPVIDTQKCIRCNLCSVVCPCKGS